MPLYAIKLKYFYSSQRNLNALSKRNISILDGNIFHAAAGISNRPYIAGLDTFVIQARGLRDLYNPNTPVTGRRRRTYFA